MYNDRHARVGVRRREYGSLSFCLLSLCSHAARHSDPCIRSQCKAGMESQLGARCRRVQGLPRDQPRNPRISDQRGKRHDVHRSLRLGRSDDVLLRGHGVQRDRRERQIKRGVVPQPPSSRFVFDITAAWAGPSHRSPQLLGHRCRLGKHPFLRPRLRRWIGSSDSGFADLRGSHVRRVLQGRLHGDRQSAERDVDDGLRNCG